MARLKSHGRMKTPALVIVVAGFFIVLAGLFSCLNRAGADNQDTEGAKKAFAEAAVVLFHPRCMNCHPSGDAPLIRDDSQTHMFNVKRGPEGKGAGAMNCTLCHGETNKPGGAPGVANWHMPPENMPMVFQGRHARGVVPPVEGPEEKRRQDGGAGYRSPRERPPGPVGMEPRRGTDDAEDEPQGVLGEDERVGEERGGVPGVNAPEERKSGRAEDRIREKR